MARLHGALLQGVSIVAFALPAAAQQAPQTAAAGTRTTAATEDTPSDAPSDVVVTGSRVARDGSQSVTPITIANTEDLLRASPTNLPDALNKLPQFQNSQSPSGNFQTNANLPIHGNVLNLRGVGGIRTLILQDGVRVPPTTYTGLADINTIPQLLVQRVETVTAGASAVYGSDAVAGVVNFVLDRKFSGVRGLAQAGISDRGDYANQRLGLAVGTGFGNGGHLIASFEHYNNEGLTKDDRTYLAGPFVAAGRTAGAGAAGTAANPYVFVADARSALRSFGGLVTSGPFSGINFTTPGAYGPPNRGTATGTGNVFLGGDYFYFRGPGLQLIEPLKTDQAFARVSYPLTGTVEAFASGSYARSIDTFRSAVSYNVSTIFSGNPYLPAPLQSQLTPTGSFNISKAYEEIGLPYTKEDVRNYTLTGGVKGKVGDRLTWNLTYEYGNSRMAVAQSNVLQFDKLAAAIDAVRDPATGAIVCNTSLSGNAAVRTRFAGCVPLNPFGVGAASQAAYGYVTGISTYRAENTLNDVSGSIQGTVFEGWAGPVTAAVGGEYRDQSLNLTSNSDPAIPLDVTGLRGITPSAGRFYVTNVGTAKGSVTVKEAFGEVGIPLLKDLPFARSVNFNGAVRYTDYSTSGGVTTWKLGGDWMPIDGLRFRVTRSHDIRAPALFDLFAGTQTNILTVNDPHTNQAAVVTTIGGGNRTLQPEIGNTFTAGLVLKPSFLQGVTFSADYFDLKITDAISTLAPAAILNSCEASGGTSPLCALIARPLPFSNTTAANTVTAIQTVNQNIAQIQTRGVDIEGGYRFKLGSGQMGLRLFATYLERYRTQQTATDPVIEFAGYGDNTNGARPHWRGALSLDYSIGGFSVFVQEQAVGGFKLGANYLSGPQLAVYAEPDIKPVFYTDATITYKVPGRGDLAWFLTVNNLFDKDPRFVPAVSGAPGLLYATVSTLYEQVGRSFTSGVRLRF